MFLTTWAVVRRHFSGLLGYHVARGLTDDVSGRTFASLQESVPGGPPVGLPSFTYQIPDLDPLAR